MKSLQSRSVVRFVVAILLLQLCVAQGVCVHASNLPSDENAFLQGWNEDKTSYYEDGKKVTGVYTIDGKLYLFSKAGKLYQYVGQKTIGGAVYYFSKDNSLETGVVAVKKNSYYFQKKTGKRYEKAGIHKVDGAIYFFSEKHALKKGWTRNAEKKKMYFSKKTYEAYTGWNYVGKYKYYFDKKGQLCQDVRKKLGKQKSYNIKVNRAASCVTVYAKDGKRGYTIPVVSFVCSAGNDTPIGTFKIRDKLRWHELMGPCWGQWCEHLTDSILFHSVYYNESCNNRTLCTSAYNRLGTIASHGCIRLAAGDAKWIFDNCVKGTKVKIYNDAKHPGPFDKPKRVPLKPGQTWDPTDPTIH